MLKEALEEVVSLSKSAQESPGGKGILPAVDRAFTLSTNVDQSVVYEPKSLMEENWAAGDKAETLRAESHMALPCVVCYGVDCRHATLDEEKTHTLQAKANGGISLNCTPSVCYAIKGNYIDRDTKQNGGGWREGEIYTLDATDRHGVCVLNDQGGQVMSASDKARCLRAQEHGHQSVACYDARGNGDGRVSPTMTGDHNGHVSDYTTLITARCQSMGEYAVDEKASTLKQRDYKGGAVDVIVATKGRKYIVRRITPLECCRLQGFPDWWEDGVEGSDTARYRMWGNGMALPNMLYVMEGIKE